MLEIDTQVSQPGSDHANDDPVSSNESVSWKRILKIGGLVLLVLFLLHMVSLGIAAMKLKKALDTGSFQVTTLRIDATGKKDVVVRAKAALEPSIFYYAVLFSFYKPLSASLSFPELGAKNIATVSVPPFKFGHSNTTVDFADRPIRVQLSDKWSLNNVVKAIAKKTNDLQLLNGTELKGELRLRISFFTMTLWLPVWLDRAIKVPITIPIKGQADKASGGEQTGPKDDDKQNSALVVPKVVSITDPERNLRAEVMFRLNYSAIPLGIPVELILPQLSINIGASARRLAQVYIPPQTVRPADPHFRVSLRMFNSDVKGIGETVSRLSLPEWGMHLQLGSDLKSNNLQRFIAAATKFDLPLKRVFQLVVNAQASMAGTGQLAKPDAGMAQSNIGEPSKLIDAKLQSIGSDESGTAQIKASIQIGPNGGALPAISGLPDVGVKLIDVKRDAPLAVVAINPVAGTFIAVQSTVTLSDMAPVLQAATSISELMRGARPDSLPDEQLSIQLTSSHKFLQDLFDELAVLIAPHQGKIVLKRSPSLDLLALPKRLEKNPPVVVKPQPKPVSAPHFQYVKAAQHSLELLTTHQKDMLAFKATFKVQKTPIYNDPFIAVSWPELGIEIGALGTSIAKIIIDRGSVSMSKRNVNPLAALYGEPISASISLDSSPEKLGESLSKLIEDAKAERGGEIAIAANSDKREKASIRLPFPRAVGTTQGTKKRRASSPASPSSFPSWLKAVLPGNVGISAIHESILMAAYEIRENSECVKGNQPFALDFKLTLPKIDSEVEVNSASLAKARVPSLHVNGTLMGDQMCKFSATAEQYPVEFRRELERPKGTSVLPFFVRLTADPRRMFGIFRSDELKVLELKSGAEDRMYLDRLVDSLKLKIVLGQSTEKTHQEPALPSKKGRAFVKAGTDPSTNPLYVSAEMNSSSTSLDINAQIDLPRPSSQKPTLNNQFSPVLSIMQRPLRVRFLADEMNYLEVGIEQALIPIKMAADSPTDPSTPYSSTLRAHFKAVCEECTSSSIRDFIGKLLKEDDQSSFAIQVLASISPLDQWLEEGSEYERLTSIPREVISSLLKEAMSLISSGISRKSTEEYSSKSDKATSVELPILPNITVSVGMIPGSSVGKIPCPLGGLCKVQPLDHLDKLMRVKVDAPDLLSEVVSLIDVAEILKVLAVPEPSGLRLDISNRCPIGVKMCANGVADIAGIEINPFTLSSNPQASEAVHVDLFANPGGQEFHNLLAPLKMLPYPRVSPAPSASLGNYPIAIQIEEFDQNMISSLASGILLEVALPDIFKGLVPPATPLGRSSTVPATTTAAREKANIELEVGRIDVSSAEIFVRGIPPLQLPPGLKIDAGLAKISINRDQQCLLHVDANAVLDDKSNLLQPVIVLQSGKGIGLLASDILEGKEMRFTIEVSLGSAMMELPLEIARNGSFVADLVNSIMSANHDLMTGTVADKESSEDDASPEALPLDLPVILDSGLLLLKRLLRAFYVCLQKSDVLFRMSTRFALKQSLVPPPVKGLRLGLAGARIGAFLSRHPLYYSLSEESEPKINYLTVGPAPCVPLHADEVFDLDKYKKCTRKDPVAIIGKGRPREVREKKSNYMSGFLKGLSDVANTMTEAGRSLGISQSKVDNWRNAVGLVTGVQGGDDKDADAEDPSNLAVSLTYSDASHLVDAAVNEGGLCVQVPDQKESFVEAGLFNDEKMFSIKIPLRNFKVPIPINSFADPCRSRVSCQMSSPGRVQWSDQEKNAEGKALLTGKEKHASPAWIREHIDPTSSWQLEFTFSQETSHEAAGIPVEHSASAVSLLLRSTNKPSSQHILGINFYPRYSKSESMALGIARRLPYIKSAESIFQIFANLTLENDDPSERKRNAISLRLNNKQLYSSGKGAAALRVNGVFPPQAKQVRVQVKYLAGSNRLSIECRDAAAAANNERIHRTIFPVDLCKILDTQDPVSVGFGAQAGKHKYSFAVSDVSLGNAPIILDNTRVYFGESIISESPSAVYLQLRDYCDEPVRNPQPRRLFVKFDNGSEGEAQLQADGIFKYSFKADTPGARNVWVRTEASRGIWTPLIGTTVYVRHPWSIDLQA